MRYNYPIIKLRTNPKQCMIGQWPNIEACNLQICPANGKQGPDVLTNKKKDNIDKIHADNIVLGLRRSEGGLFLREVHLKT
jgi:hypothetical protein